MKLLLNILGFVVAAVLFIYVGIPVALFLVSAAFAVFPILLGIAAIALILAFVVGAFSRKS